MADNELGVTGSERPRLKCHLLNIDDLLFEVLRRVLRVDHIPQRLDELFRYLLAFRALKTLFNTRKEAAAVRNLARAW